MGALAKQALLVLSLCALPAMALCQTGPVRPPEPPPAPGPPLALAREAIQAALDACLGEGEPKVAVSVIDSAGELKAMASADGVPPGHAVANSLGKAMAALLYQTSSGAAYARLRTDPAALAAAEANPRVRLRAGGELLASRGGVIGAIGVSGAASGDKDDLCALAGVARIKARL